MEKEYGLFTSMDVEKISSSQLNVEYVEDIASAWAAAIPAAAAAGKG